MGRSKIVGTRKLKKHAFLSEIATFDPFLRVYFSQLYLETAFWVSDSFLGVAPKKSLGTSFAISLS